ncbi:MAG: peptide deformylase [Candidatus Fermentibacteraceae bacterium]
MREIVLFGRDVLREKCRPLEPGKDDAFLRALLLDMKRILAGHDGLGLAGPQAGEAVCVFIAGEDTGLPLGGHTVFVNPTIELYGPVIRGEEGCLSFPGVYADVERSQGVSVKAFDEHWDPFTLEIAGLGARLVQHEYDHLGGILLVDRMGALKRRLLRSRLRMIREESC